MYLIVAFKYCHISTIMNLLELYESMRDRSNKGTTHDFRSKKGRYDDVIVEITKQS